MLEVKKSPTDRLGEFSVWNSHSQQFVIGNLPLNECRALCLEINSCVLPPAQPQPQAKPVFIPAAIQTGKRGARRVSLRSRVANFLGVK